MIFIILCIVAIFYIIGVVLDMLSLQVAFGLDRIGIYTFLPFFWPILYILDYLRPQLRPYLVAKMAMTAFKGEQK